MIRTRVLVADDHQILAEGVRGMLEGEFEVVGVVCNGAELVVAAKTLLPDVIVADITMPLVNGIEAAIQLRDAGVKSKIVFLTMHRDLAYARRAMEAGASGYVLKHSVSSELIAAIRDAVRGQTYISPIIAGELLQSYREGDGVPDGAPQRLTSRQQEVLRLIASGSSSKEVASELKISVRTAEAHRANILATLGFQSTAELVQYAIRNGIISID
jgi:DNA-binding NarL/FixJ family response regulator